MNHKMNLETLKQIANENITAIFDAFGLSYIDKYEYYQMACPIHGGDNPTAFSWKKDRGYFRCFTRHCERDGADVFDFICKLKKCTLRQARSIVASIVITGKYKDASVEQLIADSEFQRYIKNNAKKPKDFKVFPVECLQRLKPDTYFRGRGFSQEVLDEFKIGYCDNPESVYYNRSCIPVFHHSGDLVGFTGRAVDEKFHDRGEAKWFHTPGLPKGQMLFNLFKAREHIQKSHQAILCEGPLDVLKFWMAGIHNAVAVLGSDLSGPQRSLLLEAECYDLILAFDNDVAGRDSTNKLSKSCAPYFHLSRYLIPEGKDIGDLEVEDVKKLDIIKI
jgi:DNA primase